MNLIFSVFHLFQWNENQGYLHPYQNYPTYKHITQHPFLYMALNQRQIYSFIKFGHYNLRHKAKFQCNSLINQIFFIIFKIIPSAPLKYKLCSIHHLSLQSIKDLIGIFVLKKGVVCVSPEQCDKRPKSRVLINLVQEEVPH